MGRPKLEIKRDSILHVRCHKDMMERLKAVAAKNHRTTSGEAIHAIEEYLKVEEVRLGLQDLAESAKHDRLNPPRTMLLNEDPPKPKVRQK